MIALYLVTPTVILLAFWVIYKLISAQLAVIHDLVNSNLTKVQAELKLAMQRIEILEKALAKNL